MSSVDFSSRLRCFWDGGDVYCTVRLSMCTLRGSGATLLFCRVINKRSPAVHFMNRMSAKARRVGIRCPCNSAVVCTTIPHGNPFGQGGLTIPSPQRAVIGSPLSRGPSLPRRTHEHRGLSWQPDSSVIRDFRPNTFWVLPPHNIYSGKPQHEGIRAAWY